jgi:hypothetical protein
MAFGEVGTSLSKIKANSLNLAGTFGFTGTVSGLADETPLVLISTFTSDGSDATATFTSSHITSTYKEYLFVFNNIHPQTNATRVTFNFSVDNGSNYNVTKTTSMFQAYHNEAGSDANLAYETGTDLAQGTGFDFLGGDIGNGNDQSASGIFKLYNPSSTTFVKHFVSQFNTAAGSSNTYCTRHFKAGYANTTSAINNVQFKMSSGEIQGGTIDLFGVV